MRCFLSFLKRQNNSAIVKKRLLELRLNFYQAAILGDTGMWQARPKGFSLKKWVGREKALASAGHVHSLNIPEKLIYMQPAGFALTEVERSNNGKYSRLCDSKA